MKKFIGILVIVVMCLSLTLPSFAANGEIVITNADQLGDAIRDQADGQVWVIKAGTYDLDAAQLAKYASINPRGNNAGWYFPIISSITIRGEGSPVITSSVEKANGNWQTQDFISVWADDVTIDGVNIKSKKEVNKAIEVMGKDFTLKNSEILPVEIAEGHVYSGSIYFADDIIDLGESLIENVKISAYIRTGSNSAGTVLLKNSQVDFRNNYHGIKYDFGAVKGTSLKTEGFTVIVDNSVSDISQQVIAHAPKGTVISLESDITLKQQLYINDKDITIEGNGHTISAADDFKAFSTDPSTYPMNLVSASDSNLTLKNVNLVVGDKNKHTLNLNDSNVILDNVGLDNVKTTGGAPLIVNTSVVTVKNNLDVKVGEKSWYGINLDNKNNKETSLNFEKPSKLTFNEELGKDMISQIGETSVVDPSNGKIIKDGEKYRMIREIESLEMNKNSLTLDIKNSETLTVKINPENADVFSKVLWTSSDNTIVSVVDGKVTALKSGKATITATVDGVSVSCEVTVNAAKVEEADDEKNPSTGENFIHLGLFCVVPCMISLCLLSYKKKKA